MEELTEYYNNEENQEWLNVSLGKQKDEIKTGFDLLRYYLIKNVNRPITQLHIQKEVAELQKKFNMHFLEESIARYFRFTRLQNRLKPFGFTIEDYPGEKHKSWIVRTL